MGTRLAFHPYVLKLLAGVFMTLIMLAPQAPTQSSCSGDVNYCNKLTKIHQLEAATHYTCKPEADIDSCLKFLERKNLELQYHVRCPIDGSINVDELCIDYLEETHLIEVTHTHCPRVIRTLTECIQFLKKKQLQLSAQAK